MVEIRTVTVTATATATARSKPFCFRSADGIYETVSAENVLFISYMHWISAEFCSLICDFASQSVQSLNK